MLDLVLGYGGVIATSNNTSIESNNKPMNLVDIDTCLINCNRCGSYLGSYKIIVFLIFIFYNSILLYFSLR